MARPIKDGVGYFPKDTDFYADDKIRMLRAEFGAKGMYLIDYLLCEIYREHGYYMEWTKSKCCLVSDGAGCGCSPNLVEEMVHACVRCRLFDRRLFDSYGVLTSAAIQRRYVRMFNGRDYIRLIKEYFLLDINDKRDITDAILEKCVFVIQNFTENPDIIQENLNKLTENTVNKSRQKQNRTERDSRSPRAHREDQNKDKQIFGEFGNVLLTQIERDKLTELYGDLSDELIRSFSMKLKSKGYTYVDHFATILSWAKKDGVRERSHKSYELESFAHAAVVRSMENL